MAPVDDLLTSFENEKSDFNIEANQTITVGTYYVIPGMVKDFMVAASWEILNAGAVAAQYTDIKSEFFSEYQADSGKILEINFVLRRKNASNNDVTVDIEN